MKKNKFILTAFFVSITFFTSAQNPVLFKITEDNKVGYMDPKGKVVIPPAFFNGNEFSEGLASVRVNGLYGFINSAGSPVIEPQYDYAMSFQNGTACVHKNGKPYLINRSNKIVLDTIYKPVFSVSQSLVVVESKGKKQGIVDINTRKLVVDTIFQSINRFWNGIAIARKEILERRGGNKFLYAVLDTAGNFIVPPGKYNGINKFVDGYALATIEQDEKDDTDVLIDTKGNSIFERPRENHSSINNNFYEGLAIVDLYQYWLPEEKGVTYTTSKSYQGYINLKGEVVFDDSSATHLKDFSGGRAFINHRGEGYQLINSKFQQIGKEAYDDVSDRGFKGNYAVVNRNRQWGIIDTGGNFVVGPKYEYISDVGVIDSFFFFGIEDTTETMKYGMATLSGIDILGPIMDDYDHSGFQGGLLRAMIDDKLSYLNRSGTIVWQEKEMSAIPLRALNIDFMNRGYYYAWSKSHEDDLGGFGGSRNHPRAVASSDKFPENKLSVVLRPQEIDTIENYYKGMSVYVVNTTNASINFNAQDSRLYMKVQAKGADGVWHDIEYLPSSWCGNSYHILTLDKNSLWTFLTPVYEGELPTKFRIKLNYIDPGYKKDRNDEVREIVVYSDEYDGGVNPAQFWNKRTYYANGIMDPYND